MNSLEGQRAIAYILLGEAVLPPPLLAAYIGSSEWWLRHSRAVRNDWTRPDATTWAGTAAADCLDARGCMHIDGPSGGSGECGMVRAIQYWLIADDYLDSEAIDPGSQASIDPIAGCQWGALGGGRRMNDDVPLRATVLPYPKQRLRAGESQGKHI